MKDVSAKYSRGTVWWCDDYLNLQIPGVQSGRRPVLIVSSNSRGSSQSVEVLKLTLTDKSETCTSINIPITYGDTTSYALCNQHFTINTKFLSEYMYTVSESTMKKIESGLLIAQGMSDLAEIKEIVDEFDIKDIIRKAVLDLKDNSENQIKSTSNGQDDENKGE